MKKIVAGSLMTAAVAMGSLGFPGSAHAETYPPSPPSVVPPTSVSPPTVNSNNVQSNDTSTSNEAASLPNTGGPDGVLLGGAVALMIAGGATVVVSRRRQSA